MTKYLLEAIDDGVWVTVHESSDPLSIMQPSIELSTKQRSSRTTVIHDDDKLDDTHDLFGRKLNPEITKKLDEYDAASVLTLPADLTPAVSTKSAEQLATTQRTQQPTVGRIVLYRTGDRTLAAIITQVGLLQTGARVPDVKLTIFWPSDDTDARPDGGWYRHSDELEAGCWSWPSRA